MIRNGIVCETDKCTYASGVTKEDSSSIERHPLKLGYVRLCS